MMAAKAPERLAVGPCSPDTLRCADATNYARALPRCCRGHLRRMMRDIAECLDRVGLVWWLDYGTLLGAIRNPLTTAKDYPWLSGLPDGPLTPGILPHDKDADLGMLGKDWDLILRAGTLIASRGYHVIPRKPDRGLKVLLSARNRTNVDLFSWHRGGPNLHRMSYIQVDQFKGREFPADWIRSRPRIAWEDLQLPAPEDPETFLRHRYGPDWRTPVAANHGGVRRA